MREKQILKLDRDKDKELVNGSTDLTMKVNGKKDIGTEWELSSREKELSTKVSGIMTSDMVQDT